MRFAFFDFCETLVDFQTADAFVDFIRKRKGGIYMTSLQFLLGLSEKLKITVLFNKFFPEFGFTKKFKLLQLKGMTQVEIDSLASEFYREKIIPSFISPVMNELIRLEKEGYEICIVSAGYASYLKFFTKEYKIKHLISTEIKFDNKGWKCTGRISGKDCIGNEKVRRIHSAFPDQQNDFQESISYSDSFSDLPMLLLCGHGVVISGKTSPDWVKQYKFDEIIWN